MNLEQEDVRQWFLEGPNDGWTQVYSSSYKSKDHNFGTYCAFAPISYRETALNKSGWDLTKTDGAPGFITYYENGEPHTEYERHPGRDELEPLVLLREFHGVRPSSLEISEEFRLFHNLYWEVDTSSFVKFDDSGEAHPAIELGIDRVRVRTKLLRQYQAARQLDLLLFIDSVRWAQAGSEAAPPSVNWSQGNVRLERFSGDSTFGERPFTRLLGKRIVPAPPVEKAGVWPYEEEGAEQYPEFIVGTDADGENITYTSDHELLANYFGANPDAPHYLTPVHFRKEVLRKYYDNPDLYTVEDGYLQCAGLWGVQIDNDHEDRVVVFLGDLGRDLPAGEREYWRSFNISPDRRMSETGIRRSFLAQFAEPVAADLKFRHAYSRFITDWPNNMGWSLFREPVGSDTQLLQQIRVPLNESAAEFDETIGRLAKLLCDGLDDAAVQAQLPTKEPNEKSISKLRRWLSQVGYPELDRDIKFFRDLQELRSLVSAHAKGSKYEEKLTKILAAKRGRAAIVELLDRGELMLTSLRDWSRERAEQPVNDDQ